jgi:hypothetical protein
MRSRFNQILGAALADVRQEARIVLDAADGAAITFIEDPDDALRCAARGHDAVVTTGTSALALRYCRRNRYWAARRMRGSTCSRSASSCTK